MGKATSPLKATILWGVNCGMGKTDVAELPIEAIDLDKGVTDFPRPKTASDRRATPWTETVAALREALADRPALCEYPEMVSGRSSILWGFPGCKISRCWKTAKS